MIRDESLFSYFLMMIRDGSLMIRFNSFFLLLSYCGSTVHWILKDCFASYLQCVCSCTSLLIQEYGKQPHVVLVFSTKHEKQKPFPHKGVVSNLDAQSKALPIKWSRILIY